MPYPTLTQPPRLINSVSLMRTQASVVGGSILGVLCRSVIGVTRASEPPVSLPPSILVPHSVRILRHQPAMEGYDPRCARVGSAGLSYLYVGVTVSLVQAAQTPM